MTDQLLQLLATQAWQIAALAIAVAIVNRTVAKNRPHLAHALWMLVLIKCVTPPIWGHSLGLFSQLQALWKADPLVQQEFPSDKPLLMPHHNTDDEIVLAPPANDSPPPGLIAMKDSEAASAPNVPIKFPTKTANSSFVPEAKPWKPSWPMILLSLVASGALLTISIMVARCVLCLRHIHRHRTTEFDESLNEQLQRLSRRLRLRRVPRIIVSDVLFGPAVIGLWRHVIVLPRCLLKAESRVQEQSRGASEPGSKGEIVTLRSHSPEPARSTAPPLSVLDPILAHELLHIRRGDLRTGTLQAIVQSLWWFHPAVWLCNRWLSREAERCCDEQVIAELGCSPAQYARSLLSVIESKHALQPIPVFPGMKPVEITSQRMERIMSLKSNLKKQTPLWCWLAVAALAIVVLPGASPQNQPQASRDSNPIVERRYDVGELVSRLASEQNVSEAEARGRLLTILNAVSRTYSDLLHSHRSQKSFQFFCPVHLKAPSSLRTPPAATPEKLSSIRWDGDHHCVVRQTEASHVKVRESIERFKKHGFRQFEITATCISGPENDITELIRNSVGDKHKLIKKNEVATCVVPTHEANAIQKQVSTSSIRFMVQRPKLLVFNGQEAIVHTGQLKPLIVGFDDKDEPIVQTTTDGFSLQVTATALDHGLLRLQSIATLENATTVQQASISRSSAETPRQTQIPSVHVRRVQTTVELNRDKTLVQCGLTRTHEGKSEATLVILNAKPMASQMTPSGPESPVAKSLPPNAVSVLALDASNHAATGAVHIDQSEAPMQTDGMATLQKLPVPLTLVTYSVSDQVFPVWTGATKADFAPIMELIKATVEPESWREGQAVMVPDENTLSLVIRQTPEAHEQIAKLIAHLNDDLDQVAIRCRLMKLTSDQQLKSVEERCTLNVMNKHKKWALLTKERTEGIANFLTDEKCHVLLCPTITTFSGMMATIQVDPHESVEAQGNRWSRSLGFGQGSTTTLFHGCAIGVEPRIIGDSSVIRLKHSVYLNLNPQPENAAGPVTGNEGTSPLSVDESLVSSGQTLLLLIDTTKVSTEDAILNPTSDPQNGARGKYVVMLTVERLEEEEVQVRQ